MVSQRTESHKHQGVLFPAWLERRVGQGRRRGTVSYPRFSHDLPRSPGREGVNRQGGRNLVGYLL